MLVWCLCLGAGAADPADALPDRAFGVRCLFRVAPTVAEASGATVCSGPDGASSYWSLGDSGTGAVLGRTDLKTLVTERVPLAARVGGEPVVNIDWEALCPAPDGRLWIVDGGGNNLARAAIAAYEVDPGDTNRPLPVLRRVVIAWPAPSGGESPPDVEAGFIAAGSLYLVEKSMLGIPRVYRVALPAGDASAATAQVPAVRIGWLSPKARKAGAQVPVTGITDASLCGTNVCLLTYYAVFRLPLAAFTAAADAPVAGTLIGEDDLSLVFSLVGPQRMLTQAEGLVALPGNQFLVSREDGRVFCWKDGRFQDAAPAPAVSP